jgi:hypothetical protein
MRVHGFLSLGVLAGDGPANGRGLWLWRSLRLILEESRE